MSQSRLVKAALEGRKTEQRRDEIYAYPGETFELDGRVFEVVSVTRERLGDMGEDEARAEGFQSLEQYRDLILRMHRGMEWDEDHLVWVHRFRAALTGRLLFCASCHRGARLTSFLSR